jgi:hypothetical protein
MNFCQDDHPAIPNTLISGSIVDAVLSGFCLVGHQKLYNNFFAPTIRVDPVTGTHQPASANPIDQRIGEIDGADHPNLARHLSTRHHNGRYTNQLPSFVDGHPA